MKKFIIFSPLETEIEYDNLNPEPESILDDLIGLDYVDKDDIKEEGTFQIRINHCSLNMTIFMIRYQRGPGYVVIDLQR